MPPLFSSQRRVKWLLASTAFCGFAAPANPLHAQILAAAYAPEEVLVTGARARQNLLPSTTQSVTASELHATVTVVTAEDALKYFPDILVRRRHVGDTQAPIATRTSGVGASAHSLIYADGVLLSALIGNNNSYASPRWGMVAPEEIERVDVLYGPFAAAYPGNSIGAVVEITTRMPEQFEASAKTSVTVQDFHQYGTDGTYPAYQAAATWGDRRGAFSWRLGANHLDSKSQPLSYVTAARAGNPGTSGTPVTGAVADANRTGAAMAVLGAGGFEHQKEDTLTAKLAYDIDPELRATYTLGAFLQDNRSGAQTYLRGAAGAPFYTGSANIGGYVYPVPASAFSNNVYTVDQAHWMQALSLRSRTEGAWDWEAIVTLYDYGKDIQRVPATALPEAARGGPGTVTDMRGTGWYTADLKALWRPGGIGTAHQIGFGAHIDRYELASNKFNTADWIDGPETTLATTARGVTQTEALWLQDVWKISDGVAATLGARYENWRASDGFNYSLSPALSVSQPTRAATALSPKASVKWQAAPSWQITGSFGAAYRFPTVGELYQAVTTGATLSVPDPDLKPERARSAELAALRQTHDGMFRVSLFTENLSNALIAQSAPLVAGSATLFNYVQNVDAVHTIGFEAVARREDVLVPGLELQGSVTYVDSRIKRDPVFPAAIGKRNPQIPSWRASFVATYRPDDRWAVTLAARYSARAYANIDNSDSVTHTFQGFDPFFVADARISYDLDRHWSGALGIDNLWGEKYFVFHPFPQRSVTAELKYTY